MTTDADRLQWLDDRLAALEGEAATVRDLRNRFRELTAKPEPPPLDPAPMGIGYDAAGRTVFEQAKAMDVVDGSIDDAMEYLLEHPEVDTLRVHGQCTATKKWRVSGPSAQRPLLITGVTDDAEITGLWSDVPVSNLAITDLKLSGGVAFHAPGSNLLIENCEITNTGGDGLIVQSRVEQQWDGVYVRFNRFHDCYLVTGKAQGLFLHGLTANWVLEYNVFDSCGWSSALPRDANWQTTPANQLRSHCVYVSQPCGPGNVHHNVPISFLCAPPAMANVG